MKKIILIIFVSLMFSNIGFAEIKFKEQNRFYLGGDMETNIATICVDGYKFVVREGYELSA